MPKNKQQEEVATEMEDKERNESRAKIADRFYNINLLTALILSMMLAVALVSLSMGLYFTSNLYRIDLSKPKYADAREDISDVESTAKPEESYNYSSEGPIDPQSIQKAIDILKDRREKLREIGDFSDSSLSDESLEIDK